MMSRKFSGESCRGENNLLVRDLVPADSIRVTCAAKRNRRQMLSRGNAVGRAVPWENGSDSKTSVPFIRFCFGGKSAFFGTLVPLATLVPLGPSVFPILSLLGYRSLLALLCTHEIRLLWLNLMRMASCSQTHNVSLFGKRLKLQNFKIEKTSKFQNLKNSKTPKTSKLQTQRRP